MPPDLPPEFADAYRRAYERAYRDSLEDTAESSSDVQPGPSNDEEPVPAYDNEPVTTVDAEPVRETGPDPYESLFAPTDSRPAHRAEPVEEPAYAPADFTPTRHRELREDDEDRERPVWLVPALLAALIVLLLVGAYVIGRVVSNSVSGADVAEPTPDGVVTNEDGTTSTDPGPKPTHKAKGNKYAGETDAAQIGGASASCVSPSGVDAAGNRVGYSPRNIYDGDMSTAWRCDGDGRGEKLTIGLPGPTVVGEVGLIPGYAKTDPRSGDDRYAENNRITQVRWVFDDGTSIEQKLDGSPRNRDLQTIRIPKTKASEVVVEILETISGPRNTTAVSEVRIGAVSG